MNTIKDSLVALATSEDPANHELFHLYHDWEEKREAIISIVKDIYEKAENSKEEDAVVFLQYDILEYKLAFEVKEDSVWAYYYSYHVYEYVFPQESLLDSLIDNIYNSHLLHHNG